MSNNNNNKQNRRLLDQQRAEAAGAYNPLMASARGSTTVASPLAPVTVPQRPGLFGTIQALTAKARNAVGADRTTEIGGDFGQGQADELRKQIIERYGDSNNGLGISRNASGWFDIPGSGFAGGGGGGNFGEAEEGYRRFADTGGINRDDWAKAQAGYDDFARGGGVDARALRERSTAIIPSFYDRYKESAQRRSNVQGGYSPGFDAQQAEIARQAGREGFNASRQVEGDIADKIQQGRMFGIAGQGNLASTIAGMEQSGRLSGLGGLTSIAGTRASLGAQNAALAENARQFDIGSQLHLQDRYQQGGQFGTAGMADMYRSAPGDVGQRYQAYLQATGGRTGNSLNNIGTRSQIQDRAWYDYLPQMMGAGAGFMGGLGGFQAPRQNRLMEQYPIYGPGY